MRTDSVKIMEQTSTANMVALSELADFIDQAIFPRAVEQVDPAEIVSLIDHSLKIIQYMLVIIRFLVDVGLVNKY